VSLTLRTDPEGFARGETTRGTSFWAEENGDFHGILCNGYDWTMVDNDVESAYFTGDLVIFYDG